MGPTLEEEEGRGQGIVGGKDESKGKVSRTMRRSRGPWRTEALMVEAFEAAGRCIGAGSPVAEGAISIGRRLSGMAWDEAWDRANGRGLARFPVGCVGRSSSQKKVRLFLDGGGGAGCGSKRV